MNLNRGGSVDQAGTGDATPVGHATRIAAPMRPATTALAFLQGRLHGERPGRAGGLVLGGGCSRRAVLFPDAQIEYVGARDESIRLT